LNFAESEGQIGRRRNENLFVIKGEDVFVTTQQTAI
jgi:hypothetical protein